MGSRCQEVYVAVGIDILEGAYTLQWTLHNKPADSLILLHVQLPITTIPSLVGNIPVNQVSMSMVNEHKEGEEKKLKDCMELYKQFCSRSKVEARPLIVERADVSRGIVEMVLELGIRKLIMGTSLPGSAKSKKKMQVTGKAGYVLSHAINSCEISIVCKGTLVAAREGSVTDNEDFARSFSLQPKLQPDLAASVKTPGNLSAAGEENQSRFEASMDITPVISELFSSIQVEENRQIDGDETHNNVQLREALEVAENARREMHRETVRRQNSEREVEKETVRRKNAERELKKEIVRRKNAEREVEKETVRRKEPEAAEMQSLRKLRASETGLEDAKSVSKMKEENCQELTRRLKEVEEELQAMIDKGISLATQVAEFSHEHDQAVQELEAAEQKLMVVEMQNYHILKEKEEEIKQLQELLHSTSRLETTSSSSNNLEFREYSLEDIKAATGNYCNHTKLGGGGYGTVYKGQIGQATVAVKMVCKDSLQGRQEFQREIDILRDIRHPNLVTVVGACFELGCILYEYMTNGSLADRLSCKDATPPLSWHTRIRIAAEICSGLQYLHSLKPGPIVHHDLKPENILLDKNHVGKIGDFGQARRLSRDVQKESELKGTYLYMDPEYQSNGEYTTKSEVYSFGMILLQLLTGKAELGLVKEVESALENSKLDEVLDPSAGEWPFPLATQLAYLALHCTEAVRKNRPDIQPSVMQMLDKLRHFTVVPPEISRTGNAEETHVPGFFFCPISMTIMRDPCVAADGFTYEREAIKEWFDRGNSTSPMTNKKLEQKELIANHSLRSAIRQWQERGNHLVRGFEGEAFKLLRFVLDRFVLIELCKQLSHIDKKSLARQDSGISFLVELGYHISHSVSDALNLEVDFKKLNLQHYVARPNFDSKGYSHAHLSLKENFTHVSKLENFWEDCGDEFEVR
ncbi:U-box domain-containing protein 33-like [Cryptomeria japonica]|uniref:U-box domain-containing protein 33-like n=1 Tax=Cryptomeria japonica TaxID=3369 RepID=UPI0027D9DB72|nr:U-box domain-containing protein 33-like [Cryptomeria japonica]